MTARPEILAALSEGICPLCVPPSRLDDNRVCRAGIQWDIRNGIELGRVQPPCIACADPIIDCDFSEIEARLVGREVVFRRDSGIPQVMPERVYYEKPTAERPPTDRFGIAYLTERIKKVYGG